MITAFLADRRLQDWVRRASRPAPAYDACSTALLDEPEPGRARTALLCKVDSVIPCRRSRTGLVVDRRFQGEATATALPSAAKLSLAWAVAYNVAVHTRPMYVVQST